MLTHVLLFHLNGKDELELAAALRNKNIVVYLTGDVDVMWQQVAARAVDLVLITTGELQGAGVMHLCRELRKTTVVPLMLLARSATDDLAVQALDEGVDLVFLGQCSTNLIAAQVEACLRRFEVAHDPDLFTSGTARYVTADGRLAIDLDEHSVRLEGAPVPLTATEFRLLSFLVQHADQAISYDQILHHIWGWEAEKRGSVHVCVRSIRRKLGEEARTPRYIVNEFGFGYRFRLSQ